MTMRDGGKRFEWEALVPCIVNPAKVAIIEALLWIDQPLSATELTRSFDDDDFNLSQISYHLSTLADAKLLTLVREKQGRGAPQKFYFFP
jgi:DNA-binding transcriptional ArsR family regulator